MPRSRKPRPNDPGLGGRNGCQWRNGPPASPVPSTGTPGDDPNSDAEKHWKESLEALEKSIKIYHDRQKDGQATEEDAKHIADMMDTLADSHPDPDVKKSWSEKAAAFRAGDTKERESILEEVGKGLLIILATPFLLVGAGLVGAGAIIYGVGSILKGIGSVPLKLLPSGEKKTEGGE